MPGRANQVVIDNIGVVLNSAGASARRYEFTKIAGWQATTSLGRPIFYLLIRREFGRFSASQRVPLPTTAPNALGASIDWAMAEHAEEWTHRPVSVPSPSDAIESMNTQFQERYLPGGYVAQIVAGLDMFLGFLVAMAAIVYIANRSLLSAAVVGIALLLVVAPLIYMAAGRSGTALDRSTIHHQPAGGVGRSFPVGDIVNIYQRGKSTVVILGQTEEVCWSLPIDSKRPHELQTAVHAVWRAAP